MKHLATLYALVLAMAMPLASAQPCEGVPPNGGANGCPQAGTKLDEAGLEALLCHHGEWLDRAGAIEEPGYARLCRTDLRGRDLSGARLAKADLRGANLRGALLVGADLAGADLVGATLIGADLTSANLRGARLSGASMGGVDLSSARLEGADFSGARLYRVNYQPAPGERPNVDSMAEALGLSTLVFENPRALVALRKALRVAGHRQQERQLTYALRVGNDRNQDGGLLSRFGARISYLLFEVTTEWGLHPGRALLILSLLLPLFAIPYAFALASTGQDGIWRVWLNGRVRQDLGDDRPERLTVGVVEAAWLGFCFSIISAFSFGRERPGAGNWITRIHPREYTLQASGWLRSLSSIQSLLSAYLLLIWALTAFGRPFG